MNSPILVSIVTGSILTSTEYGAQTLKSTRTVWSGEEERSQDNPMSKVMYNNAKDDLRIQKVTYHCNLIDTYFHPK